VFTEASWICPSCGYTPPSPEGYLDLLPPGHGDEVQYDPAHYPDLAALEERSFWFQYRAGLLVWALRRHFPRCRRFLEVGCGTGYQLLSLRRALPDLELAGSEFLPDGLAFAASRVPGVELYRIDARALPFDAEFDAIGAFDVLEHIVEDERCLTEMCRSLRPGGGVVITVPQHMFLWSAADEEAQHVRRYARRDLRAKLVNAGFDVVRMTSFVAAPLPLQVLSRRLRRDRASVFRELTPHPVVSRALGALLGLEGMAVRAGLNLPAGGSLLAVARVRA
jgi:SAM-dependent methyltransferase